MLCYAFRILRQKNYSKIGTEDFLHVQDMLAAILSRGIAQQLKQGLCKSYIGQDEQTGALRGKLDPYETAKLKAMKIRQFRCSFDELSADNGMNRILKSAAAAMIRSPEVSAQRKKELRQEMWYFGSIGDIDLKSIQWNRLQYHRNNRSYEMLMNICYMISQSLLPSSAAGNKKFSLFDEENMPRLYEKFILEYYRQHFPSLHAADKSVPWDIPEDTDPKTIQLLPGMHTDITLNLNGHKLIIDAKYYRQSLVSHMDKQMIRSANIYQIYTYVKNADKGSTGLVSGMLLYAKTTEETEPRLSVSIGGNRISVRTLDLNRAFAEIAQSLDEIVYEEFGTEISRTA